jgi:hypothetical protein
MPDIIVRVSGTEDAQDPGLEKPQATISLNARKTLDGNLVIFDHDLLDIVIMPSKKKVMGFSKKIQGESVYNALDRLFEFLTKKGVVQLGTIQGGNIYGSLEATYPESPYEGTNSVQILVKTIANFITEERPFFGRIEDHLDDFEEELLEPEDEKSTELGEVPHRKVKGTIRPGWIRSPAGHYANSRMYRA